jgi:hypothetical protein
LISAVCPKQRFVGEPCSGRRDQGVTQVWSRGCQTDPAPQVGSLTQVWSRGCQTDPAAQVGSLTQVWSRGCQTDPAPQLGTLTQRWSRGCHMDPAAHVSATSISSDAGSCEARGENGMAWLLNVINDNANAA